MTMDSIPTLFSQLREVFPELEAHSYFELDPDVKDLVPKCRVLIHIRARLKLAFVTNSLIWAHSLVLDPETEMTKEKSLDK